VTRSVRARNRQKNIFWTSHEYNSSNREQRLTLMEIPLTLTLDCIVNENPSKYYDLIATCSDRLLTDLGRIGSNIAIMPAGAGGTAILQVCKRNHISVECVIDNDIKKHGLKIDGIPIVSVEEVTTAYEGICVIVAASYGSTRNEIIYLLEERQLPYFEIDMAQYWEAVNLSEMKPDGRYAEIAKAFNYYTILYSMLQDIKSRLVLINILNYRVSYNQDYLKKIVSEENRQYFEPTIYPITDRDYFVDCGAFNGDTFNVLMDSVAGKINGYYGFEPTTEAFNQLVTTTSKFSNVLLFQKGVYSKTETLRFDTRKVMGAHSISEEGNAEIDVISLDEALKGFRVTFIKMDIEGAEMDALNGAKTMIQEQNPVLAISVYHKTNDLYEIPLLIESFGVKYNYYLRHYTLNGFETILYAVPVNNHFN